MSELGPNAFGELVDPGRVDCYLGLPLPAEEGEEGPGGVLVVAPRWLLHPAVPQPAGSLVYELATGHPDRQPGELVFPADLTEELRAWPTDTWAALCGSPTMLCWRQAVTVHGDRTPRRASAQRSGHWTPRPDAGHPSADPSRNGWDGRGRNQWTGRTPDYGRPRRSRRTRARLDTAADHRSAVHYCGSGHREHCRLGRHQRANIQPDGTADADIEEPAAAAPPFRRRVRALDRGSGATASNGGRRIVLVSKWPGRRLFATSPRRS